MKTRRVFSDRTCDWCLQASQSALYSGQSSYMTPISLRDRCDGAGSVQMCRDCEVGAPPRRRICNCNNSAVGSCLEQGFTLRCLCSAGNTLATSYRGLKCFHVHILGGEAGKVHLHRLKTGTALLANNGEEMTRRWTLEQVSYHRC